MGFFKTIWMWIKRILFIVCMAVTALFATSVFTDDEAVRNALSIIMAIVVTMGCTAAGLTRCRLRTFVMLNSYFFTNSLICKLNL